MDTVRVLQQVVTIPTYKTGEPCKHPMFLEKRVYQGSSGKVYPHPVTESVSDEKIDKKYTALFLENQYLSVNKNIVATQGDEKKPYMVTTPKTKSSIRNIPIPKILMEDMKVLYEVSKRHYGFNDDWYLFGDTDPITNGKLRHRKNKDCKLAEVKQIRIHDFRHSCASLLINSGASIMVVAKYLGHANIDETLNTYSHLLKNKMEEAVKTMESLD